MTKILDTHKIDELLGKTRQTAEDIGKELGACNFLEADDIKRFLMEVCNHTRERLDALKRLAEQRQNEQDERNTREQLQSQLVAVHVQEVINLTELHSRLDAGETVFVLGRNNNKAIILNLKLVNMEHRDGPSRDLLITPRDSKDLSVCRQYDILHPASEPEYIQEILENIDPDLEDIQVCEANDNFQDQAEMIRKDWRTGIDDFMSKRDAVIREKLEEGLSAVRVSERIDSNELIERLKRDKQIFILGAPSHPNSPEIKGLVIHFYYADGRLFFHMRSLDSLMDNAIYEDHACAGNRLNSGEDETAEEWEIYFGVNPKDIHVLENTEPFVARMQAIQKTPDIAAEDLIM